MTVPLPVGESRRARQRRIEQIAAALRRGTYRVPAEDVAAAVLAAWRRDLRITGGPSCAQ